MPLSSRSFSRRRLPRARKLSLFLMLAGPVATSFAVGCASERRQRAETASVDGEEARWEGQLRENAELGIYAVNGGVEIETVKGSKLEVSGTPHGGMGDQAELVVIEGKDKVVVCTVYPGGRCDLSGYHSGKKGETHGRMDLHLRVPEGHKLSANTVNGSVKGAGLGSEVEIRTVNGDLELAGLRHARVQTVNGTIQAQTESSLDGELSLRSVNGGLELRLPAPISAEVDAKCVNGRIHSEFPLEHKSGHVGGRAWGSLGVGGPKVQLQTVNGSIQLESISANERLSTLATGGPMPEDEAEQALSPEPQEAPAPSWVGASTRAIF